MYRSRTTKKPSSARVKSKPIILNDFKLDRPQTADIQQSSITYNPFTSIKSELSLDFENLTHRKNHQNITPRTRYNTLQKYASLHSLNLNLSTNNIIINDKENININKDKNMKIVPLIPLKTSMNKNKRNKRNINLESSRSTKSISSSSLSIHSQIQNNTTSVWLDLLTARYSRKKEEDSLRFPLSNSSTIDLKGNNLHQFAMNQQKEINQKIEKIQNIFNSTKERNRNLSRPKSQPNLSLSRHHRSRSQLKRAQTASNLHRQRDTKKDLIQIELDRKLNYIRSDPENKIYFQNLVDRIKANRSQRNVNTNYLISNKKMAKSYSKDILLKNAKKANNKWYKNSMKMKLYKIKKDQLLEQRKEEFDEKLRENVNESRKSLIMAMKKEKMEKRMAFKHFQQKYWLTILMAFKIIDGISSLYQRMDEIKHLRTKQHEAVKIMEHFYRKYVVSKRRFNDKEIIKLCQRTLRIYAIKYNFKKNVESAAKILLFLKQLSKIQGLVSCVERLDLNGKASIIQSFWRKRYLIIQCQKKLMFKHFIKYEQKYINNSNKNFTANSKPKNMIINNSEFDKKRQKNLTETSISNLPKEFIRAEINTLYWQKKKKYYQELRKWTEKYKIWKVSYDKQLNAAKMKQQLGIKVNVKYNPPSKPILGILLNENEITLWIKQLHSQYLLKRASNLMSSS